MEPRSRWPAQEKPRPKPGRVISGLRPSTTTVNNDTRRRGDGHGPALSPLIVGERPQRTTSRYGPRASKSSSHPKSTSALPPASDILGKAGKVRT